MKKVIVSCVALALAGMIGWQVYQKVNEPQNNNRKRNRSARVAVEIRPVQKSAIRDVRSFTGTLLPKSQFVVAPKISGRLKKLMFNLGDKVKAGQLVATLDDEEFLQQVDQARATLEVARANLEEVQSTLENAKREFERTVVLREKKIASESELDEARSRFKTQQAKLKVVLAQVVQKEAELKVAQVRLSYTRIQVPPNNGNGHRVVGERYVHEGALLAPNKPIVSIIDIRNVIAAINVIERDYSKIKVGMQAVVTTDAFPDRAFSGKVVRMAPQLQEASRQAKVEVEIDNIDGLLKPGMFAKVQIEFDRHENTTVIPLEALIKHSGAQGVFLADAESETARFIPLTLGIVNGRQAEVLKPELDGFVVTLGQHLLEDGGAIILPSEKPKSPEQKEKRRGRKKNKKK